MSTSPNILQRLWAAITNRYEAGQRFTGGRSYIPSTVQDARFDADKATRQEIVRKSRYFEKNSGLANRLADLFEQYTTGATGLVWNPASHEEPWNQAVKTWLDGWYPFADISSRQSWGVLQSLVSRTWFFDGECFLLKTRGQGIPAFPRVQLIESHRVGTPPALAAREGKDIVDGIEVDPLTGRPLAYWIADTFDGENYRRVEAIHVVHVFEPSRPGQMRGLPLLYPVLNDLHGLDDLQILEMKAAKDAAEVSNVILTENGEDKLGARSVRQRFQITTQTSAGTDITQDRVAHVRQALGGRTVALKIGEDLKQFKSERPSAATNGYWDRLETKICGGVGIPRGLVYAASLQGTVARADYDVAATFFRSRSQVLIDAFRDVYFYIVDAASKIERSIADKPSDWTKVTMRPPRAVNVDVGRNASAQVAGLAAGTETLENILSPMGIDWRDWVRQRIAEAEFIQRESAGRVDPRIVAAHIAQGLGEPVSQQQQEPIAA